MTQVPGATTDYQSKDKASCVAECSGEEGRRSGTSLLWSKELLNWLILLSNFTLNILVIQKVIASVPHKMVHDLLISKSGQKPSLITAVWQNHGC